MTATIWHDRLGAAYVRVPAAPAGAPRAALLIMRTPVTNALWRQAVAAGACDRPRSTTAYDDAAQAQHPVGFVSRAQARAYAAWIGGRLPRDSEWTRAAQGDDGRTYPWGEQPPDATRANCQPHGPGDTTPVGSYPAGASPYGLLDMAGNVWEWVDPDDGGDQPYLVRGGAFFDGPATVACTARETGDADTDDCYDGFRVVIARELAGM
jgi:formylglycine-generating enzyme required for sulfatase activity